MTKSKQIIHSFSVYEIKRGTIRPYNFRWTKFHENNSGFQQAYPELRLNITEDELIICSTVIDADNYSLLTTQRIITKEEGIKEIRYMASATSYSMPRNYKFEHYDYLFGTIEFQDGEVFRYFLEPGKAAMVMIQGIKTLIWSQQLTDLQMINLMRIWDKRFKNDI